MACEASVSSYPKVFHRMPKKDAMLEPRLVNVIDHNNKTTSDVCDDVCMGIFEHHKLVFSFQQPTCVMDGEGELDRPPLAFVLQSSQVENCQVTCGSASTPPNQARFLAASLASTTLLASNLRLPDRALACPAPHQPRRDPRLLCLRWLMVTRRPPTPS